MKSSPTLTPSEALHVVSLIMSLQYHDYDLNAFSIYSESFSVLRSTREVVSFEQKPQEELQE